MAESKIKFKECITDLSLSNCTAWGGDNTISRIGDRVFVSFSVHLNTVLGQGGTVVIADLPTLYKPKTDVNFVFGDAGGDLNYGYVNKSYQNVILSNSKSRNIDYVCGSFSYQADS